MLIGCLYIICFFPAAIATAAQTCCRCCWCRRRLRRRLYDFIVLTPAVPCKAKRQYVLTVQVSTYCLLSLQSGVVVAIDVCYEKSPEVDLWAAVSVACHHFIPVGLFLLTSCLYGTHAHLRLGAVWLFVIFIQINTFTARSRLMSPTRISNISYYRICQCIPIRLMDCT